MSLNLNLNIQKPLVFLKVATTGINATKKDGSNADRIVEISITKISADRVTVETGTRRVNPGFPISEKSTEIHGITDADVADKPKFEDIAQGLFTFIGDCDFAGFNISFDLSFLSEEFHRVGLPFIIHNRKVIDLKAAFFEMEKRDFSSAVQKYTKQDIGTSPIGSEQTNIHTINILNGMVDMYSGDDRFLNPSPESLDKNFNRSHGSMDILNKIILNEAGRPVFNFGKYMGQVISEVYNTDPGYFDWCINVSDMIPADVKFILKSISNKVIASNAKAQNQ